ncbi:MAG: RHS repeat-associated core domain-containing protein [Polyangiaceae bacterium]
MARTAPFPNFPAIPGMNPGVFVLGGGHDGGGSGSGGGKGRGNGQGGSGGNGGNNAGGDGKSAPDPNRYPDCGTAAHPVDVVTGRAFTHPILDVALPGPLPLRWHRVYSTAACERDFGLGWGWAHSLGWQIEVRRRSLYVWTDQGTKVAFPSLEIGGEVVGPFGWLLHRDEKGYLLDVDDGVLRRFAEPADEGVLFRLTSIEDRNRNMIALEYEAGRLVQVTDSAGRVLVVDSREDGRIERVRVWASAKEGERRELMRYRHDGEGCLIEATDPEGHSWRYAYDEEHRLTRDTDRTGLTFAFVYDAAGRCVESWGHYGDRTDPSLAPDVPAKLADGITPAKGIHHAKLDYHEGGYTEVTDSLEVRRFFGNAHGLLDKAVSAGAVFTATYDDRGFQTSRTDEEGHTTLYERDGRGRILKETDPLGRVTVTVRDDAGRPMAVIDPAGGTSKSERDGRGNEIAITDACGGTTHYAYDSRGLVTTIIGPTGGRYAFEHDKHGNRTTATYPNGAIQRWTYDAVGRCQSEIDQAGRETRFRWSRRGDLLSVERPDGGVSRYEYDGEAHLTAIADPEGRTTLFGWGGYHKLVSRKVGSGEPVRMLYDREGNQVLVRNEQHEEHSYTYDPSGLIIAERTFDGREIGYRHDLAGRLVRVQQGPESVIENAYDAAGQLISRTAGDIQETFDYDARGELIQATRGADAFTFERDACGRVVRETSTVDGVTCSVRTARDAAGLVIGRSTSQGHTLAIHRDGFGVRCRTTIDGVHELRHEADPFGREIRRLLPEGGRIDTTHAPNGRLASRRAVLPGPSPESLARLAALLPEPSWLGREPGITSDRRYGYDRSGELLQVVESSGVAKAYRYDDATRLLEVSGLEGPQEAFRYDATGNPQEVGPGVARRLYSPGNRLLKRGEVCYLWNDRGQLIEKRLGPQHAFRYLWTEDGRLATVIRPGGQTVDFRYDPFGRRTLKRVYAPAEEVLSARRGALIEEVRFLWDGHELVHEFRTRPGAVGEGERAADPIVEVRTYGFEDGGHVPLFQQMSAFAEGAELFHYLTDPVGAPEQLADGVGHIVCHLERAAFGAATIRPGAATSTPLRFQGQYADEETGLHYNRYRYYDPAAGHYISPDPLGLPGGLNLYGYGWNPTHWIDPLGLAYHTPNSGVIYLRTDQSTGKEYVGRSMSLEAFQARRGAHNRALQKRCPGSLAYNFQVLQGGIGNAPALAQAEESWIRAGGGPGGVPGQSGPLENKMHAQAAANYTGPVPFP